MIHIVHCVFDTAYINPTLARVPIRPIMHWKRFIFPSPLSSLFRTPFCEYSESFDSGRAISRKELAVGYSGEGICRISFFTCHDSGV